MTWPGTGPLEHVGQGQPGLGRAEIADRRQEVGGDGSVGHPEPAGDGLDRPRVQARHDGVVDVALGDAGVLEGVGKGLAGQAGRTSPRRSAPPRRGSRSRRGPASGRGTRRWPSRARPARPPRRRPRRGRRRRRRRRRAPRPRRPSRCGGRQTTARVRRAGAAWSAISSVPRAERGAPEKS